MALFNNLKNLKNLKRKAEVLAVTHGDKIAGGIDKAAQLADKKTSGKHSAKIGTGAVKAKEAVEKLAEGGRR